EAVRKGAAKFPEKLAEEKTVAGLRTLQNECDSALEKTAEARRLLQAALSDLAAAPAPRPADPGQAAQRPPQEVLARAAGAIRDELSPAATDRLELFVGQARAVYPEGKTPPAGDRKPEKLLSLAITSWLLGNGSAETDPETAARLWRAREMVLAYLREQDLSERHRMVTGYLAD